MNITYFKQKLVHGHVIKTFLYYFANRDMESYNKIKGYKKHLSTNT